MAESNISKKHCSVDGCDGKYYAKDLCGKHYQRVLRTGTTDNYFNGRIKHPLYDTWKGMKARCYNKNSRGYEFYGGKGITVCDRWLDDFLNFAKDMGDRPDSMTLDRIDSNGNYTPKNCRWADSRTQIQNRSSTKLTLDDVIEIRKLCDMGQSNIKIAEQFNVAKNHISQIRHRKRWDYRDKK